MWDLMKCLTQVSTPGQLPLNDSTELQSGPIIISNNPEYQYYLNYSCLELWLEFLMWNFH
jgi:hypothetical protein